MTLPDLLTRCSVNQWHRHFWFRTAKLTGASLLVSDEAEAGVIRRCWLAQMREHVPDLEVVVAPLDTAAPAWTSALNAKGRKAYRGQVEQQPRLEPEREP